MDNKKFRKFLDEPTMSDKTLLISVEDLISGAFGSAATNVVNFKLIQVVLHILARQLRLLEQEVEIKFDDMQPSKLAKSKGTSRSVIVGNITLVTNSQFELLEDAVNKLMKVAGPLPPPSMPDNAQLRKDLAKGRASLTDTMQAMQLNARVQAAEEGLQRMAELLTQLTAAGLLPPEVEGNLTQMRADLTQAAKDADLPDTSDSYGRDLTGKEDQKSKVDQMGKLDQKSKIDQMGKLGQKSKIDQMGKGGRKSKIDQMGKEDQMSVKSVALGTGPAMQTATTEARDRQGGVTFHDMEQAIASEKGAFAKEMNSLLGRANNSADAAYNLSKSVSEKLDIALKMDERLTNICTQTADYANQLQGFDAGVTTQMTSFQEQMGLLKNDLSVGLKLFDAANNSAESAAIMELNERCEGVAIELESTVHQHQCLTLMQNKLNDDLQNIFECLEMLREQKADRDEVNDGLRDKANNTCLVGLLHESDFAEARLELLQKIGKSYDKFHKQEGVWLRALDDLLAAAEFKAPMVNVEALKRSVEEDIHGIQKKLQQLEIMLGEPKAAILMRKLAANAACGLCLTRALMEPTERTYAVPLPLPPLRPAPPPSPPSSPPCLTTTLAPIDTRKHICNRWVAGSHTLMARGVPREQPHVSCQPTIPRKKYQGSGSDGKLYLMEEDYQPCEECNKWGTDHPGNVSPQTTATPPATDGGGDQVMAHAATEEEGSEKEMDKTVIWE